MTSKEEAREATEAELAQQAWYLDRIAEIESARRVFEAMYKLQNPAKRRVMAWLNAAFFDPGRYANEEPPF